MLTKNNVQGTPRGYTGYYKRLLLATLIISGFFVFTLILTALAQDRFGVEYGTGAGLSTQDVRITIANIIRYALGVIGIVFLVLIIYGGVTWMLAGGEAQKVEKAKKIITNAVIGLIIIFLAFGIVSFVIGKLEQAVNSGGGGGPAVCGNGICEAGEIVSCPSDCSGLPGGGGAGFNVIATNPNDQQTGVKVCQRVQAMFNADLMSTSVNDTTVNVHPAGGAQITGGTYTFSSNSFSLDPLTEFDRNTTYEATVTTQVQSTAGTNLEREKVWTFTTGTETDSTLPTVATVYPTNGETNVCLNAPIQAIFSEEMDVTTFTVANILLEKQDAAGAWVGVALGSITPGTDFKSFSAYPAAPFDANSTYRVRLLPGILDSCGNPLDGNGNGTADGAGDEYQWNYTTGDTVDCTPLITAVNPGADYYSEQDIVITGNNFFSGGGSDAYFNNFATDTNCFQPPTSYVPNQSCRVSWSNTEIRVRVPVGSTSGPLVVMVGTKSSNSAQFQVQSPYMGGLSPSSGPVSQYVTIGGIQFGSTPGRVEVGGMVADIPPCSNYWTDTSIVIKIPTGLAPGSYPVQVFTAANKASNRLNFMVTTGPLGPGMCSLNPTCGPSGQSATITGERFGVSQGTSSLTFSTLTAAVSSWSDTALAAAAPAFPSQGGYPVAVTVGGLRSNEIWFTTPCVPGGGGVACDNDGILESGEQCDGSVPASFVCTIPGQSYQCVNCQVTGCGLNGSCNNNDVADASEQCDDTNGDGIDLKGATCQTYSSSFNGGTLACTNCGYNTSGCLSAAVPPQVVENQQCVNSIQSPTPWRDSTDACRNAQMSVTFDRDMNQASFVYVSTHQCGNGAAWDSAACNAYAVGGGWTSLDAGGGREAWLFTPSAPLVADTWYQVTVPTTVTSAAGVPLAAAYEWHFRVRPGNVNCTPDTVAVSPVSASIAVGGTQPFNANATANNCNLLTGTFGYQWTSSNITQATVTGSAGNQETATGVALTGATPVRITAQIQGTGASGYGELTVTTGSGSSCDACGVGRSQLVGGVCTSVITTIQPSTSPVGSWVTIQGCYFGAARGSVTYNGNHPGLWPDPAVCGTNTWTDTQIISEVPNINTADVSDDAQSGPITVTRADGAQATHPSGINIAGSPHPNLCRLTPASGLIGAAVNVAGNGFGATRQSQDYASFGATQVPAADYTSWASTSVNVRVPAGAATGNVNVTITKGTSVSNPLTFQVINNGVGVDCDSNPDPAVCAAVDSRCNTGLYCNPASCTCQTASALLVTSFMPSTVTDICPNAQFSFTFDQLVDRNTVNTHTFFVQEGPPTPCPPPICLNNVVGISLSIEDGDFTAGPQLESRVHIIPSRPLALSKAHTFLARGGPQGVKSRYGAELGNPSAGAPYSIGGEMFPAYAAGITTGSHICQIDHVTVTMTRGTGTNAFSTISNRDLFTCARINCLDDVSAANGNQHAWRAQAWDASSPPQALTAGQYMWTKDDPDNLFGPPNPAGQEIQVSVTQSKNGSGAFSVGAHDPNPTMGSATTTVSAEVSLCENPWPTFPLYPFVDSQTNFSFWYCRDAGASDTQDDDLPALNNPVVKPGSIAGCADCLKEFLFLRDVPPTKDAIGLRIYSNLDKLSLAEWYQTNVKRPGSPSSFTVDGFPAIRDGRSVYVLAPNISGTTFYTNIFLISYNEGAEGETISIFNGLVATWKFLINLGPVAQLQVKNDSKRMTDLGEIRKALLDYGKAHGACNNTGKTPCVVGVATGNGSCPTGYTCQATYPKLAAGSYIPGQSTSRWPSWQATLGNALLHALPKDPLNAFPHACSGGGRINQTCSQDSDCYTCGTTATQCRTDADCPAASPTCNMTATCVIPSNQCPAPLYDQQSCWNDTSKVFDCPDNSRIYAYQQTDPVDGLSFTLGANLEYLGSGGGSVAGCSMNYRIGPNP